jgi:probable phosphoglycerate mutase
MTAPRTFSQKPFEGPPGSTEVVLIRHGASADSVEGEEFDLVDGQGDPPLSPIGREQAELVGARLAREEFAALYVSTLRRTSETAAPLVARSGLVPVVDPDLREIFLGEWEGGIFRQKVADQDEVVQQVFMEGRWDPIPGAETSVAFGKRLRDAITRIGQAHAGHKVAVFSHGAAIAELMHQASHSEPFSFLSVDNASISRLIVTPDRWMVRGYNDRSHLDPEQ